MYGFQLFGRHISSCVTLSGHEHVPQANIFSFKTQTLTKVTQGLPLKQDTEILSSCYMYCLRLIVPSRYRREVHLRGVLGHSHPSLHYEFTCAIQERLAKSSEESLGKRVPVTNVTTRSSAGIASLPHWAKALTGCLHRLHPILLYSRRAPRQRQQRGHDTNVNCVTSANASVNRR